GRQWQGNTTNSLSSRGTTTDSWSPDSTGIFAHLRSPGVQDITDGTTNTVAFSEGLIPTDTFWLPHRGGVAAKIYPQNSGGLFDARTNVARVMSDLALCTQYFQAHQFPVGANDKEIRWAYGGLGLTSFNTIVPPNST